MDSPFAAGVADHSDGLFSLIALVTAAIFAVDLNLYGYWGFRLDGSVLIYLADPGEALASASWGEVLRQIIIMLVYAGAMIWSYRRILRLFRVEPVSLRGRIVPTVAALLIGGLTFLAIRGGVTVATANVSKVYFSSNMFLNHAATNPVFRFSLRSGTMRTMPRLIRSSKRSGGRLFSKSCGATVPGPMPVRPDCCAATGRTSY